VRVTDAILFALAKNGFFVFNYIDDLFGLAPDSVADSHFQLTINLLNNLGFHISDSKTVAPTYVATCLGITFNISMGYITIPKQKLLETISLCKFYFFKKFITKNQLQVLIGHLIFLHKAVKPARVFVNRILALLRKMGDAAKVAIDEGTKRDLQWFMACAHAVNGTVKIYKSVLPRIDIFVDASLTGLGGVLGNYVYCSQTKFLYSSLGGYKYPRCPPHFFPLFSFSQCYSVVRQPGRSQCTHFRQGH
jgi:hypothetical protein